MARLPQPGGDNGNWGNILNDYLSQSHNGDGSLKDIHQSKVVGLASALNAKASTTELSKYSLRDTETLLLTDFLSPGQTISSDGSQDVAPFLQAAINEAAARYGEDGLPRTVYVPVGKFRIDTPITPPDGGGFGIAGAGMDQTVFIAPVDQPFLYNSNNPDPWTGTPSYKDMVFRDFTIDAGRHTLGTYDSSRKGIFIQRVTDSDFYRVKIKDTHATGFGLDYCHNVSFVNCVADSCGRGRLAQEPLERYASGAGIGIGAGGGPLESVTILNCITVNNGSNGIFIEHLGRTDAYYDPVGFKIIGNFCAFNNVGIGDQGSIGSLIQGNVIRENGFAGLRLGVSGPGQHAGYDGHFTGNTVSKNGTGVMIVGTAWGGYNIADNSIIDNVSHGIHFPQIALSASYPALTGNGLKISNNRILRNGGSGILADTASGLPDVEISDNYIKDNGLDAASTHRDGITFLTPMGRPRILRNRIAGNYGRALALRGTFITLAPRIMANDYDGSPGGTYLQEHTIADTSHIIDNLGNSTSTVTNLITNPTPKNNGTGWSGGTTTRTRVEGGYLGNGAWQGIAVGAAPALTSPAIAVSEGQMWTGSIYVKAPAGKKIRSAFAAGAPTTYRYGSLRRATGDWQRVSMTAIVPSGMTTLRVGVVGADFEEGAIMQVDAAMLTPGPDLWPYIDGTQPNCTWSGTAFASTSIMTMPS